jgi:isopenicillin N synthase-like dioxygenase
LGIKLIFTLAFYGGDSTAKAKLVEDIKHCCLHNGFFQIVGHQVPLELQTKMFQCSKSFFDLPLEEKSKVNKGITFHLP